MSKLPQECKDRRSIMKQWGVCRFCKEIDKFSGNGRTCNKCYYNLKCNGKLKKHYLKKLQKRGIYID
jgi:hypothetical protein